MEKTNVMRILEQKKICFTPHAYSLPKGVTDGLTVARLVGLPPETVFKTLVTQGADGGHFVFVIPVSRELNLKAAAKAVGQKSLAMLPQAKLLPLTGYVHGGCSPVGMKKVLPTVVDQSALELPAMAVSAGKIGFQVELAPHDLAGLVGAGFASVTEL